MGNYRPISLLSATSKVLEKIVAAKLSKHIAPFLPTNQSGFRKADGTVSQLNRIVHTLQQRLDNSKTVLAVFYDLSKAFDRVWHEGLLKKLSHLGLRNSALSWLRDYLTGRQQCVQINGIKSAWRYVSPGVPKALFLAPSYFLSTHMIYLPYAIQGPVECDQLAGLSFFELCFFKFLSGRKFVF